MYDKHVHYLGVLVVTWKCSPKCIYSAFKNKSKKSNKEFPKPGMVAFACNLSTWEDEEGALP